MEERIADRFVVGDGLQQGGVIEPRTFDTRRHKRIRLIDDDGAEWAGVLYAVDNDTDAKMPAVREH